MAVIGAPESMIRQVLSLRQIKTTPSMALVPAFLPSSNEE
jgi:hypothetical protein